MADKDRRRDSKDTRAAFQILDFERPIVDLENRIIELESLSQDSSANIPLNLNGELKPLRDRLDQLVRETFASLTPWQQVQVARVPGRPLASDYVDLLCDEFMELHGDRGFRDDPAILTGIGRIGERRLLVVAHRKGQDLDQRLKCNFGSAHPEGYRKALRKMRLAEKFGLPILALINTPGAYPGIGAEERGQAWAIAENLMAMFSIRVPIVCVVIGEGGSGGALGIGIGDRVLMMQHSYYSVISPEGCAAILWKDAKRAPDAAEALKLNAQTLHELEIIDEVIEEPQGAAHRDAAAAVDQLGKRVTAHFDELEKVPIEELLEGRYRKFRAMGTAFGEESPLAVEESPDDAQETEPASE